MQPGTTAGPRRRMIPTVAAILGLLGGYVVFVARKSARVEEDLARLEDELERQRAKREGDAA